MNAGEPLMFIVPERDELTVEVRIPPQDIDQLRIGQPAVMRFTAFNQRTTPEINGVLSRSSADIIQDQRTGAMYYLARMSLPGEELARLRGLNLTLVPGMPVEAFIQTGFRTVISYLVKPMSDQVMRAFREK